MTIPDPKTVLRQALAELLHCVEEGPRWFTNGRTAQMQHAEEWYKRGIVAIDQLESEPTQ